MPQAPRANTPTEVLAGLVECVTFHNAENGFCVLRVKARGQRDLITILGYAAMISARFAGRTPGNGFCRPARSSPPTKPTASPRDSSRYSARLKAAEATASPKPS